VDDLLLLLNHYWARDISTFPTERYRVQFALILLLLFGTGCRPVELVDVKKKRKDDSGSKDDDLEIVNDNDTLAMARVMTVSIPRVAKALAAVKTTLVKATLL
jgi:integrase